MKLRVLLALVSLSGILQASSEKKVSSEQAFANLDLLCQAAEFFEAAPEKTQKKLQKKFTRSKKSYHKKVNLKAWCDSCGAGVTKRGNVIRHYFDEHFAKNHISSCCLLLYKPGMKYCKDTTSQPLKKHIADCHILPLRKSTDRPYALGKAGKKSTTKK